MKNPASILAKKRSGKCKYSKKTITKAASELGRLGGLSGGPARAEALNQEQRTKIASHAARVRWGLASV